jgi:hypothetical protein
MVVTGDPLQNGVFAVQGVGRSVRYLIGLFAQDEGHIAGPPRD